MTVKRRKAIAAAAILHDIGKFAERAGVIDEIDPAEAEQEYRYGHAANTTVALSLIFGSKVEERISTAASSEENLLNLASRHHKPRGSIAAEIIVCKADRLVSGHERMKSDDEALEYETVRRERKSQVPLISILGRISAKGSMDSESGDSGDRYYRLSPIQTVDGEYSDLFPVEEDDYPASQVRKDYPRLWDDFRATLQENGVHPVDEVDTLIEVSRLYQWCIPASTRKEELPDVSLFEHQKGCAAIAACLDAFHEVSGITCKEAIFDDKEKKYLLFCGDVAGIQKFIYQVSSKGAYRLLKGRSFYVHLLCELAARHIVKEAGLTTANILYASGGKFYLLLPNLESIKCLISTVASELNEYLLDNFKGDLFLRTGYEEISGEDLTRQSKRTLSRIWEDLTHTVALNDRKRYADLPIDTIKSLFAVSHSKAEGDCPVCHATVFQKGSRCRTCEQLDSMGRSLGTAGFLLLAESSKLAHKGESIKLPLGYRLWLLDQMPRTIEGEGLVLWSLGTEGFIQLIQTPQVRGKIPCAPLMLGSNHRFDKEFDEIAGESNGVKRLGVLRMDVDNLGRIFSHGLQRYRHGNTKGNEKFYSLARITTLSSHLSLFFSGILPRVIATHEESDGRVGIVYSGGDDLFLLGAWDALPTLALRIRDSFSRYCCDNPAFSLSGGLVLTGGKFPVYKSAEMAGEAESKSKKHKGVSIRNGNKCRTEKNAFTFLDTVMHWDEFHHVKALKDKLLPILEKPAQRPLLRRLHEIYSSWELSRKKVEREGRLDMESIARAIDAEKWRWQMVYSLSRHGERTGISGDVVEHLQRFLVNPVGSGERTGIELLGVLARWCELLLRKQINLEEREHA